jgi:hypothetical protein
MGISWGYEGSLEIGSRRNGRPVSWSILLTSLRHVNWRKAGIALRRIQFDVVERFLSSGNAPELTVAHKTVAEPL